MFIQEAIFKSSIESNSIIYEDILKKTRSLVLKRCLIDHESQSFDDTSFFHKNRQIKIIYDIFFIFKNRKANYLIFLFKIYEKILEIIYMNKKAAFELLEKIQRGKLKFKNHFLLLI